MKVFTKSILLFSLLATHLFFAQAEIISEEMLLKNDSILLPGTLSYDKNLDQQALVIYVHGSGNVDRNGNQAGAISANYIKQLADALNKKGIAFYRYDKRTATQENMNHLSKGVLFTDFVADVNLAIQHFKDDPRFSTRVLVGHSQGSLVAMLALSDEVDKYVSIAGPASTIDEVMTQQVRQQNGDEIANIVAAHFSELKETGTIEKVNPMLFQLFNTQNLPFLESWIRYNPTEEIQKISTPTCIINGTKDIQVSVEEAQNLHTAKPDAKLMLIKNMNHILKHIEKEEDNLASYASPDFPLSEELVEALSQFIKA